MGHRSARGALALAHKYVVFPSIFERETKEVFQRNWIFVCHVSQLSKPTNRIVIELNGSSLIVARAPDGTVRAFRNICRHRGARLINSNEPTERSTIQCPYHAWTYDLQGKLVAAPNMKEGDGFCAAEHSLLPVPVEVANGMVWIDPGSPGKSQNQNQSLAEFLAPVQSVLDTWSVADLECVKTIEYSVRANWKLIFQNYSECYHCPSVHPALNRLTPYQGSSNELEKGPILGGPMQLADDCETMSTTGHYAGSPLPGLDDQQRKTISYFTIFPSLFLSVHPDYVLLHRLNRKSVNETTVLCDFLFHPNDVSKPGFDPQGAFEFWDLTNRQDWRVCELAQTGMSDPHYIPGPYSHLESVVAAFDQHYFDQMSE